MARFLSLSLKLSVFQFEAIMVPTEALVISLDALVFALEFLISNK